MADWPNRLTVAARSSAPALLAAAIATTTALASCSHSTGSTVTSSRGPTSTAAAAPAPHTSATPVPAPPASDEDQAKATVIAFQDAYNTQNWDVYSELMCGAMLTQFNSGTMEYVKKGRAANGPATIKSMTIAITGDDATATIDGFSKGLGPGPITLPLKRENGWKVCQVYHP